MSWNMDIFEQLRENGRSPQPTPVLTGDIRIPIGITHFEHDPLEGEGIAWYLDDSNFSVITKEEESKYGGMI